MRYVAAYLLAVLGGKEAPTVADLEKILSSVGVEVDQTRITKVVADLKGKSVEELIKEGREKLSSVPSGGAAVAAAPGAAGPAAADKKDDKRMYLFHIGPATPFANCYFRDEQTQPSFEWIYIDSNTLTDSIYPVSFACFILKSKWTFWLILGFQLFFTAAKKEESEEEEEDDDMGFGLFE